MRVTFVSVTDRHFFLFPSLALSTLDRKEKEYVDLKYKMCAEVGRDIGTNDGGKSENVPQLGNLERLVRVV